MQEIINTVAMGFIGSALFLIALIFIFILSFNVRKKIMQMPVVISNNQFSDIVLALNQAKRDYMRYEKEVPIIVDRTLEQAIASLDKSKAVAKSNLAITINSQVREIAENILEILEDGKYNYKDIPETYEIIKLIGEIGRQYPAIEAELKSFSKEEFQIFFAYITEEIFNKRTSN